MSFRGSVPDPPYICVSRGAFHLALALALLTGCGDESSPAREAAAPSANPPTRSDRPVVLFLGDSLTAGYGLDPEEAYPALIQGLVDGLGLDYEVVNGGLSGDTTSGGLRRIDWLLRRRVDVLVLALGGNDALRGIDVKTTEQNLRGIIDKVRAKNPAVKILLAGMQAPPSMGRVFTEPFRELFPRVADEEAVELMPFLLEEVGGDPGLNQSDGIHPTAKGQEVIARNVFEFLQPLLGE